jgi:hypothetical protein
MIIWASLMLIAGGLFAGGAATFAWSRVPIWRRMPVHEFIGDFEETLRRTDKVQPALLVAAIVSAGGSPSPPKAWRACSRWWVPRASS